MKLKKRFVTMLGIVTAALFLLTLAAAATGGYGSADDPLITLSYITDIFRPEIEQTVAASVEEKSTQLKGELEATITELESKYSEASAATAGSSYTVISIESGKKLVGKKGCEIMLRVGSAHCSAPASPGLIDTSDAAILENGSALLKNHMYMITIDGRGIVADNDIMIIVRGDYTIE